MFIKQMSIFFLKVRDPGLNNKVLGRYCTSDGLVSLAASGNELKIRFRSDYSVNGRGFKAQYFSGEYHKICS